MDRGGKCSTAAADVRERKSLTLNSRRTDESQTERQKDRKTGRVRTGSVQPAVFRTHAVCCLIGFASTTNSL